MPSPKPPISGLPHPDVEIVQGVFRNLTVGETITHEEVAKAIGMNADKDEEIVRRRATTARKRLCTNEGINIDAVRTLGYIRETDTQTLARVKGRDRRGVRRKARRMIKALECIEPGELNESQRQDYCAERMLAHVTYQANGPRAKQVMLAAAKVSQNQLPMSQALEVLKNGKDGKE